MFCVNDAQAVKSISHLPNQQMSCKMSAMATTAQVKNLYGCIQAERFLTGLNVLKGMQWPEAASFRAGWSCPICRRGE
jgi:hypothetical protein